VSELYEFIDAKKDMLTEAEGVLVRIDETDILQAVGMTAEPSTVTGLIGPNGSGKSTLLRCVYRALKPTSGTVHIGGDDVWRSSARQAGLRTAVVAQDHDPDNDYSVLEIVTMGRNPHQGMLDRETGADRKIVEDALARVGMERAAHRVFVTLSGGERQRVLVARALTQEAPVLLLDEPTNHLDIGAQHELLDLVKGLGLTTTTPPPTATGWCSCTTGT
jgi:iron complex transport system ATP-binding protein